MSHQTKIDWAEFAWNPVHGCAMLYSCAVRNHCYASRMAARLRGRYGYPKDIPMRPTFEPERLQDLAHLRKPRRIFVCSMGDLWGDWVDEEWIKAVLDAASKYPQHTYMFLTKNPQRYSEFYNQQDSLLPEHSWVGTTINKNIELYRLDTISSVDKAEVRFISFEPLMEQMINIRHHEEELEKIDWFIIGAQTRPKVKPQPEWVWQLLDVAREHGIKVFLKSNLGCTIRMQELPTPNICDRCGMDVSQRLHGFDRLIKCICTDDEGRKRTLRICWDCDHDIANGGDPLEDIDSIIEERREQAYEEGPINNPPPWWLI